MVWERNQGETRLQTGQIGRPTQCPKTTCKHARRKPSWLRLPDEDFADEQKDKADAAFKEGIFRRWPQMSWRCGRSMYCPSVLSPSGDAIVYYTRALRHTPRNERPDPTYIPTGCCVWPHAKNLARLLSNRSSEPRSNSSFLDVRACPAHCPGAAYCKISKYQLALDCYNS